jgi:hypothetical protein
VGVYCYFLIPAAERFWTASAGSTGSLSVCHSNSLRCFARLGRRFQLSYHSLSKTKGASIFENFFSRDFAWLYFKWSPAEWGAMGAHHISELLYVFSGNLGITGPLFGRNCEYNF